MSFFHFPNQVLKLKVHDQLQNADEESLLARHIKVICATFWVSFSLKSKGTAFPILKLKACDQSKQPRKKLFCDMIIKYYLCNDLCKLLIKSKACGGTNSKNIYHCQRRMQTNFPQNAIWHHNFCAHIQKF